MGFRPTTGPTGSGKTTTLYSILHSIYTPELKILTIEDPVEHEPRRATCAAKSELHLRQWAARHPPARP
jgi:Tfp pilus assembly pilus retraction ATPase PilT